jgi:hypothetical protein
VSQRLGLGIEPIPLPPTKVVLYQKGYRGGSVNGHPRSLDYGFTNVRDDLLPTSRIAATSDVLDPTHFVVTG